MLCAVPFRNEGQRVEYPCGQCLCCRINKRREWATRIVLECSQHLDTQWVTLTYAPEYLPTGGTLVKSHVSLFMRSLRKALSRSGKPRIRFFAVGEYGSRTHRPHYHVFLFGLASSDRHLVRQYWRYGHVYFGHDPVNSKVAEYTAGYTVKKEGKDASKLRGRCPEFSLMSLRPPIGAQWAESFGSDLAENKYFVESIAVSGIPRSVKVNGKLAPLGRTLYRYLRRGLGYDLDRTEEEKVSAAWVRSQTWLDADLQARRSEARKAGHHRARARQSIFGKRETL